MPPHHGDGDTYTRDGAAMKNTMNTWPPPLRDLPLVDRPLPYTHTLDARSIATITCIVIHCTELPDFAMARTYGERALYGNGTGNSGHFYIDRDGRIEQYVPLTKIAHHVRRFNRKTIGIELINRGRYPHWLDTRYQAMTEPYPPEQILALRQLLRSLCATLPHLTHITGHENLDCEEVPASNDPSQSVRRKRDPGPLFPWDEVMADLPLILLHRCDHANALSPDSEP